MAMIGVCFDMDGVIIDSEPIHFKAFQQVLSEYGFDLDMSAYQLHFAGRTDILGFENFFNAYDQVFDPRITSRQKTTAYLDIAAHQLTPYPSTVQTIVRLSDRGVPLALVTSSNRDQVELMLQLTGLHTRFDTIVSVEDIRNSKPNPEGYLLAAERLKLKADACIVVEDAPSGIAAAKAANMYCVALSTTHPPEDLIAADIVVPELRFELFDHVIGSL